MVGIAPFLKTHFSHLKIQVAILSSIGNLGLTAIASLIDYFIFISVKFPVEHLFSGLGRIIANAA
jgi:hypothetical protein